MHELAQAWRQFSVERTDVHLLLVGPFESEDPLCAEDLALFHQHSRVHLVGAQKDAAPFFAAMDIFVMPSHREGFGVTNIEAASMCLPVVATLIPGCVDSVQDSVTGTLVPARDGVGLLMALRRYCADPELRREHGQAGRRRVIADFGPEHIWQQLYDLYQGPATQPRLHDPVRRALDLAVAVPLFILTLPIQAATTIAIRTSLGSPVLFRQNRPGLQREPFEMIKFRTMMPEDPACGWTDDASRITRLGRILRSTSFDELPTLWSIIRGDMSLVGPRPLLMCYLERYSPEQSRRHEVKPGLTGLAQVSGCNNLSWEDRFRLDVEYVDNHTLVGDLKIIRGMVLAVARREGISAVREATMSEFLGTDNRRESA